MDKKTLEMLMVGTGSALIGIGGGLQAVTYYLKYTKPIVSFTTSIVSNFKNWQGVPYLLKELKEEGKKAGKNYLKGTVPSLAAKACFIAGTAILTQTFIFDYVKTKCKDYPGLADCLKDKTYGGCKRYLARKDINNSGTSDKKDGREDINLDGILEEP